MKKLTRPTRKLPTVREGLGIKTLPEMIDMVGETYSEHIVYRMPRNGQLYTLKYWQLLEYVRRIGRYLRELGLEKGDHIAIVGENRPEWAISYFSVPWIGGISVPLDARASFDTHKFIIDFAEVKAVIASGKFIPAMKEIQEDVPHLKHVISMEDFESIFNKYARGVERENVRLDDLLEILFTSGTTGDPKGVMLTHRNIMSNVDDIYRIIDIGPDDISFSILPIHHSYECTVGQVATVYSGVQVFYGRSLNPREMMADIKMARPTFWLTVPLLLEKMYVKIRKQIEGQKGLRRLLMKITPKKYIGKKVKEALGFDRLRFVVSGGAALPRWVSRGMEELGFPIIQGYGLSETSPLISVNPPHDKIKNESVGLVIPSDEVEIRDVDSEGNGEIVVRGPNVMKGYYRNETATRETFTTDGWLMTGDIGYFDEEGYLYITGRKKFVIVTKGGKNVFPEEIEEKLTKSPLIEEAMVFSPDDEQIQALIYPDLDEVARALEKMGREFNDENVWQLIKQEVDKVNRHLEAYKRIRHFAIRFEEFPKTTTRKIKRHLFRGLRLTPDIKVMKG